MRSDQASGLRAPIVAALVTANRILAGQAILDAYGHVSCRTPADAGSFLLSRSMAPARVRPKDVMRFDLEGTALDGDDRKPYLERFIHAAIYASRPDAAAIVHSHAEEVLPFGLVPEARLAAIFHMCGFLGTAVPVFEIRDVEGPSSDLLVKSMRSGAALARTLGEAQVVLMRGHGMTCVGETLPEAVYHAIYAAANARVQAAAGRLGEATFLSKGEAASAALATRGQVGRAWDLWSQTWGNWNADEASGTG